MDSLNPAYEMTLSTNGALAVDLRDYMETTRKVSVGINKSDIFDKNTKYHSWYVDDIKTVFNRDWIGYIESELPDFYVGWCAIILRKSTYDYHTESAAHVDCNPLQKKFFYYGLNFTLQDDDSEMVWYDMIDDQIDFDRRETYFDIPSHKLKEIYRFNVKPDKLSIVNTSVIHDVDNKGKDRWAVSLRGLHHNQYGSWEKTLEFFQPCIINTQSTPNG